MVGVGLPTLTKVIPEIFKYPIDADSEGLQGNQLATVNEAQTCLEAKLSALKAANLPNLQ